jgi:hypothetical protein
MRPSGTVTFLFTDIAGSTRLWEQHPDLMPAAFQRQEAILRQAITDHSGYAYKMIGDAFQAAFATAPQALAAALAAQRALAAEDWGAIGPLWMPMALDSGTVEERGDDYIGPLLNRTARLLATGYGGQISSQMPMRVNRVLKAAAFSRDDIVNMHYRTGEGRLIDRLTNRQRAQSFPTIDLGFLSIPAQNLQEFPNLYRKTIGCPAGIQPLLCCGVKGGPMHLLQLGH